MKLYDVSLTITNDMIAWPGDMTPDFRFGENSDMSNGDECNVSNISMCVHAGTHVDAPKHFIRDGKTIEYMSLDKFYGKAKVIELLDVDSIGKNELEKSDLAKDDIVIFKTKNSEYIKSNTFNADFVYIALDGAKYLAEIGVKTVGIDYISVGGYHANAKNRGVHKVFLSNNICIIEGLMLSEIQEGIYTLSCFPLKIAQSEGSPARAVLISD